MAKIRPESLKLLCNKDLIALNQDPLHLQAYVAEKQGECFVLVKDIKRRGGTERAFAIYNPSDEEQHVLLHPMTIELGGAIQYYDCIRQERFVTTTEPVLFTIPAHGTKIMRAKGEQRMPRVVYEAETAFMPAYQELRNNQNEKSAVFVADDMASGGYKACWLGGRPDNDIQWRDVFVRETGSYKLVFTYFGGEDRTMELDVNGEHAMSLATHSRDWGAKGRISVPVTLKRGLNTIRLYNNSEWMPDIDRMVVLPYGTR
jgi:hypothetical protein